MDPKLFISKDAISPVVCKNRISDCLTRVHPLIPFVVFIPVSLFFIGRSIYHNSDTVPMDRSGGGDLLGLARVCTP